MAAAVKWLRRSSGFCRNGCRAGHEHPTVPPRPARSVARFVSGQEIAALFRYDTRKTRGATALGMEYPQCVTTA